MAVQGVEVFGEEEDNLRRRVMVPGAAYAALPPPSYCFPCWGVACLVCVCVCVCVYLCVWRFGQVDRGVAVAGQRAIFRTNDSEMTGCG